MRWTPVWGECVSWVHSVSENIQYSYMFHVLWQYFVLNCLRKWSPHSMNTGIKLQSWLYRVHNLGVQDPLKVVRFNWQDGLCVLNNLTKQNRHEHYSNTKSLPFGPLGRPHSVSKTLSECFLQAFTEVWCYSNSVTRHFRVNFQA